jgi:hypothetical protein
MRILFAKLRRDRLPDGGYGSEALQQEIGVAFAREAIAVET